jgi:glycerol-3-phosphate acyltransferase PlsX
MRIVLDAMGSDHAPGVDVEGGVRAARRFGVRSDAREGVEILMVGRQDQLSAELSRYDTKGLPISIVHASQVVAMDEQPSHAVRSKPDSSMVVGMKLLRGGEGDAFVSAGHSGGVLAAAIASAGRIGRIKGVMRPALSAAFPAPQGTTLVLDIGANTDCRPEWLVQFALMGSVYCRRVLGVESPRVALLSNGEEDIKGNQVVKEAHQLLSGLHMNYVGHIEGKDLTTGMVDVIVADGFVGNVALKTSEGIAKTILTSLRSEIQRRPLSVLGALLARPALKATAKLLDYREFGGAPLLGVNGVVIVGHGRSDALAIENAIRVAIEMVRADVVGTIRDDIQDAMARLATSTSGASLTD